MLEVCCGVTNGKEKDGGARGLVKLRSEGPRVTRAPLCAKCSNVCSRFEPSGSCCGLSELINLPFRERAHPLL